MLLGYARGKVGDLVFSRRLGQQTTRAYNATPKDAKTRSQVTQRVKMANVIAMYRALKNVCNHSFEALKEGQSSYSAFVSANLKSNKVTLTKEAASLGACVVAPYLISRGSLASIIVEGLGADATTNIAVGELQIDDETTIGAFADALVANNAGIEYGDQLTYISCVQQTDVNTGYPVVVTGIYEVTLNQGSTDQVRKFIPQFGSAVKNGFLAHGALIGRGGFAWILSRKPIGGSLMVSTQRLILTSPDVYSEFASESASTRAISSYGYTIEPILNPGVSGAPSGAAGGGSSSGGSSSTGGSPSVSSISIDGQSVVAGSKSNFASEGTNHTIVINGSNFVQGMVASITMTGGSQSINLTSVAPTTATGSFTTESAINTNLIKVSINGAVVYTWQKQSTELS